jgi:hypothetical protein
MKATSRQRRTIRLAYAPIIALACALAGPAPACAAEEDAPGPVAPVPAAPRHRAPHSQDAAAAFAKRLNLDAKQQAQVRRLLVARQSQIRRVWNDPAIPGDERVGAVKSINEGTEAQIRALLTEEQRQHYIQPRPAGPQPNEPQPSVEDWQNAIRHQHPDPSAPR